MFRKPVALLVALYAIAFAFLAMTVVRWPTLMTAVALAFKDQGADLSGFNWRALGLQYGVPYIVAAIFFQISSYALATRSHGAVTAFVFGVCVAFPVVFVFDFREGWMAAPTMGEWVVVWIAAGTLLLFGAVWDLRRKPDEEPVRKKQREPFVPHPNAPEVYAAGVPALKGKKAKAEKPEPVQKSAEKPVKPKKPVPRRRPSVMVELQRRRWAEEGRRAAERRNGRR